MYKNIFRCYVCGRHAISEELDEHECRPLKDYKIVGNILKVFDGKEWYPLKLEEAYPTEFDRENYRRRLDRTELTVLRCVTCGYYMFFDKMAKFTTKDK